MVMFTDAPTKELIKNAMNLEVLSLEEEQELVAAWLDEGDLEALEKLATSHVKVIIRIAKKYSNTRTSTDELIQQGMIGLLEAARRFDRARNTRFATYASWWIRAEIQHFVMHNWSLVKMGTTKDEKSIFFNFARERARVPSGIEDYMNEEDIKHVATALEVKERCVRDMEIRMSGNDYSLDMNVGDDSDAQFIDNLVDARFDLENEIIRKIDDTSSWERLKESVDNLPERDRLIFEARRMGNTKETLDTLGRRFGISKERVRQIEVRAFERVKKEVNYA